MGLNISACLPIKGEEKKEVTVDTISYGECTVPDLKIPSRGHVEEPEETLSPTADQHYDSKESHSMKETNTHHVHYPNHPPRKDTPLYRKTHHNLCKKRDLPCYVCGRTQKRNKIVTETHHYFCEKAAELGTDWIAFGKESMMKFNPQTGQCLGTIGFNWEEVAKNPGIFVDSEANMVVLCPEHHRSADKGIHHVPGPEWILQKHAKDGFEFLSR